jgi:hypothetical protein
MSEQPGGTNDASNTERAPSSEPPPAGEQQHAQPPAPEQLEPGRGAPLVAGPPRSVSDPIDARKVNTVFGIGGVLGLVAIIIVVILVGLLLISLLTRR